MIFLQHGIIDKVSLVKRAGNEYTYIEDNSFSFNIVKDIVDHQGTLKLQYYYVKTTSDADVLYYMKVKVNLAKFNSFVIGTKFDIPVYSSVENAIPTVSDENYGTCNYLDKTNSALSKITLLSRFVNIKRISLYVASMDKSSGKVSLNVKFGSNEINNVIRDVTGNESWIYIENTANSSGEITVTRNNNLYDTLSNICIITGIRVETE